jgi:hypothetical protein
MTDREITLAHDQLIQVLHLHRIKLFTTLGKVKDRTTDSTIECCSELARIPSSQRHDFISTHWSVDHAVAVQQILLQLDSIEHELSLLPPKPKLTDQLK